MTRRKDGRTADQMRPLTIATGVQPYAEGSCMITAGDTRVLCTASIAEGVPRWREGSGEGWVTAEYGMLPRATHTRTRRERSGAGGRTREIQRLIGRSLRAVTDLAALGAHTVTLDCDVLQADGGTRTASITGAWVALALAGSWMVREGRADRNPVREQVAAVSVGIVDGVPLLDLEYREDSSAQVDMNVVATGAGELVEIQGTAESAPFTRGQLDELIDLALGGLGEIIAAQRRAVGW